MHVRIQKIPALALAAALQVLPVARVACVNQAAAPSGFAIICRWVVGAVALLGSYHAVSGASAAIAGLQNLNPPGPLTTNTTGTVGQAFAYRIVVTNPGINPQQAYYNAAPLPPGLTINTNLGANGAITGTPTTAGVYQVLLTAGNANYVGVVTNGATITITGAGGSPPQITGPPTNQTVQAGSNVTFRVTATGTSPLSYSWKFGTTAIAGATNSSLQLPNVQTTSSGTYTVTVTNAAGSASAFSTLTVNAASTPPAITTQPQSLTVTNGDPASFSVVASGTAPLSYQWRKDAAGLLGATNSSYSISLATPNDAGSYTVVVTNSSGSVTSSVAILTVLVPPSIVTPPQSLTVTNGGNASFSVVASGTAPLNYQWLKNASQLQGATNSSYSISQATTNDSGTYTVTVTSAAGSASASATLTVNAASTAPAITTPPQSLTVTNGGNASFSVVASGTAPLSYQWRKDAAGLLGATNSSYSISLATTNDAGNYTVVVTNSSGSVTSSVAALTVLVPPSIVTQPQSLTVTNGVDISFSVVASGTAPLSYQWKLNGNKLAGATAANYVITNAQPAHSGDYTVDVSNSVGTVTSSAAHLIVQGPPSSAVTMAAPQWTNSTWLLQVSGPAQTNYVLWRSDSLATWAAIKTNFSATGSVQFTDTNSLSGIRFYKASLSP